MYFGDAEVHLTHWNMKPSNFTAGKASLDESFWTLQRRSGFKRFEECDQGHRTAGNRTSPPFGFNFIIPHFWFLSTYNHEYIIKGAQSKVVPKVTTAPVNMFQRGANSKTERAEGRFQRLMGIFDTKCCNHKLQKHFFLVFFSVIWKDSCLDPSAQVR